MIHFTAKRCLAALLFLFSHSLPAANPIITNVFTADPAALVYCDTVYLYTGNDAAPDNNHARSSRAMATRCIRPSLISKAAPISSITTAESSPAAVK